MKGAPGNKKKEQNKNRKTAETATLKNKLSQMTCLQAFSGEYFT